MGTEILERKERLLLKHGRVIDPSNKTDDYLDLVIENNKITCVKQNIIPEKGERVIECEGLYIWPGLIDMHLHIGDLFEITTQSAFCAANDGVTFAVSPGAGNTFMAPALLGAEVDRGMPINIGILLGGQNILASMLSQDELVQLFNGELPQETAFKKLSKNMITNRTAPLILGIKDHMGHVLMSDENIDQLFDITERAGLLYMSHTQDPEHTLRLKELSRGRSFHLGHANAAGCGTHCDPEEGMKKIVELCKSKQITGEFVSSMLRGGLGTREGLKMTPASQRVAYDALNSGIVDILVSDGQNQSTMKGFGSTRDNIPCILELAEKEVLSLMDAVATMTANPVKLFSKIFKHSGWLKKIGNLQKDSYANITIVDPNEKRAVYTIVNGKISSFDGRILRNYGNAGYWMCNSGLYPSIGVGEISLFKREE